MFFFLGSIYPQYLLAELTARKQFADYPADVFQQSLLKGLDEHIKDIRVITSPVIRSPFAQVKDICKKAKFSHNQSSSKKDDIYVGTVPIPGLQMIFELLKVYSTIRKELKKSKQKQPLIIYALHSPFLLTAVMLRKLTSCSCVIVPDLPEFMSKQDGVVKKMGKKLDRLIINFCLKRLDCYVLLSSYMRDRLPINDKPWTLMEGVFDTESMLIRSIKCKERVVLYCGNLSKQYGIIELLHAFNQIKDDNYRLWICGRGDGESDVLNMATTDKRIKFFGVISHDEVLNLQQQATVLINPRSSSGEYTKYSFPSKTMEYLASGTPTIMCHLPAIPKEYDEHIFYIKNESIEGIRDKIVDVCEIPQEELDEFGKNASEFIKKQKNAYIQSQKVVDLINRCQKVSQS